MRGGDKQKIEKQEKVQDTRSWFFEKIDGSDKSVARLTKKKKRERRIKLMKSRMKAETLLQTIFLKVFQKIEKERALSEPLYEASISLMSKQNENQRYRPTSVMNTDAKHNKMLIH